MRLFIPSVAALAAATLLASFVAWKRRWLQALITASFWIMPIFFVADLQFWLYNYGHTMDPEAALNTGSFTPKVFGTTHVWNFHSETSFALGFYFMVLAALVITGLAPAIRWFRSRRARQEQPRGNEVREPAAVRHGPGVVARAVLLVLALGAGTWAAGGRATAQEPATGPPPSLQQRIDQAAPGDLLVVDGGVYHETIVIDKPLSLIGNNRPVIDGGSTGDVVTIVADEVILSGFHVRGSSRVMSQESAAIKVNEADRVTIRGNLVEDSRYGLYLLESEGSTVAGNTVDLGAEIPMGRRGYGVYLWQGSRTAIHGNTIRNASDGVHLEFSEGNGIGANVVKSSRYGLPFMYANSNRVLENTFRGNLAGAVLMFSHDLLLKDNEFSENRRGATGAGILLKDCDNPFVEGNLLLRNKYGMTVEGTPQSVGATAVFHRNLFALNDTGVALMPNAPITFVDNAMIENTVQVQILGGDAGSRLLSAHSAQPAQDAHAAHGGETPKPPAGAVWTLNGSGNYWSDYRGYDADGDGVGDRPYLPEPPFAGRLTEDETLRLFQFTLAQQAIDVATDMFPLYQYDAVIEDSGPLMEPPPGLVLSEARELNVRLLVVSAAMVALAAWVAAGVLDVSGSTVALRARGLVSRRPAGGGAQA